MFYFGRQCRPGTTAITTEFPMPLSGGVGTVSVNDHIGTELQLQLPSGEYEKELVESLELLELLDGHCGMTGDVLMAYIQSRFPFIVCAPLLHCPLCGGKFVMTASTQKSLKARFGWVGVDGTSILAAPRLSAAIYLALFLSPTIKTQETEKKDL